MGAYCTYVYFLGKKEYRKVQKVQLEEAPPQALGGARVTRIKPRFVEYEKIKRVQKVQ